MLDAVEARLDISAQEKSEFATLRAQFAQLNSRNETLLIKLRAAYVKVQHDPCGDHDAFAGAVDEILERNDALETRIAELDWLARLAERNLTSEFIGFLKEFLTRIETPEQASKGMAQAHQQVERMLGRTVRPEGQHDPGEHSERGVQ